MKQTEICSQVDLFKQELRILEQLASEASDSKAILRQRDKLEEMAEDLP